jgi:ubiquitin-conjugating enzyme E2 J2
MAYLPTTLKRIKGDIKLLHDKPHEFFDAMPDEKNMLIWYFLIRGTDEYQGGWYLGKIELDNEYPFKPPDILLLTPSGRYEINIHICLSFTKFHPEQWASTWNIMSIVGGVHSNMNEDQKTEQGIGYINNTPEQRAIYARNSINYNMKYHKDIFLNFTRLINPDGTPKTDDEIKASLITKKEKKKKEKSNDLSHDLSNDLSNDNKEETIELKPKKKSSKQKENDDVIIDDKPKKIIKT